MKPAEGTILTVSRVCAEKALEEAVQNRSLEHVLEFCLSASRTALEETVNQNPVLKKAGVVDAGGMGFFYILEGMLKGLRGEVVEVDLSGQAPKAAADFTEFATEDITFGYCTEFIVSRENDKDPELLIAVQPTRGLDVGAIEYIHKQIVAQRDAGKAVLLVSLELDEVMSLSDRILVIYEGEIVGELDPKTTTAEEMGLYMAGAKRKGA